MRRRPSAAGLFSASTETLSYIILLFWSLGVKHKAEHQWQTTNPGLSQLNESKDKFGVDVLQCSGNNWSGSWEEHNSFNLKVRTEPLLKKYKQTEYSE